MKNVARFLAIALVSLLPTMAIAQTRLNNYQPGPRLIDGTQLNLMVAAVNGMQGNGGSPGKGYFSLNTTGTTGPTPESGTVIQAVGANATTSRIENDAFGAVPIFTARRANGTKAAPTLITSGDQLGSFNFGGAISSTAYYTPAASLRAYATETWSGTAGGNKIVFSTTPNTTQTLTDAVTIGQDQTLTVVGAISGPSASVTGLLTSRSATATPAAASAVSALTFGSAGIGIYWGTGAPSFSSVKGSIYIQTDGSTTATRMYINNGTTAWVAFTTAS